MCKRTLIYFVLSLIVLQSAMAVGDVHQQHQSGTEHVAFDGAHQHLGKFAESTHFDRDSGIDNSDQKSDCQHCCHGHFSPAMISAEHISLSKLSSPVPDYSENTFPKIFESLLRPPKA